MSTSNQVRAASDHNCITAVVRSKDRQEQQQETLRRNRRGMDIDRYRKRIQEIDWRNFYKCREVNKLNDIFVTKVGDILEKEAPMKGFQIRRDHKNWLNEEIKTRMKERDLLREEARTTGDASKWLDYRKCRNKCTKELEKLKTEHFRNLFKNYEAENDSKEIHNTTRKLLNWKTGGGGPPVS